MSASGSGAGGRGLALLCAAGCVWLTACRAPESTARAGEGTPTLLEGMAAHAGVTGEPRAMAGSRFWDHWGDGNAELSSYRVRTTRYGEPREGELVLIYVTEPHDRRTWIKDDDVTGPHRVEVLKLNASLKFLTGIYPYSVMTSVFSPVDDWGGDRFRPVKISMSAQEWCGNVHHEVWPGPAGFRHLRLSYFAGEGETMGQRETPEGTAYADGLLIQLRELDGPFAGGGDWEGWLVPSLWDTRRGHGSAAPVPATITREALEDSAATRFTLRYAETVQRIDVEAAYPRRILGWTTSGGDTVELVESRRLPYWRLNDREGARFRSELGLDPDASGRPPGP